MQRPIILHSITFATAVLVLILCCSPGGQKGKSVLEDSRIRIEVTPSGGLAVSFKRPEGIVPLATGQEAAFLLVDNTGRRLPFGLKSSERFDCPKDDPFGPGQGLRLVLALKEKETPFEGVVLKARLCLYESRPGVVLAGADAEGLTEKVLSSIQGTRFYAMTASADLSEKSLAPYDFYLFQGAVYKWGEWYTKIKLTPDYDAPNWTVKHGEKQIDSGGLPLDYLWTRKAGLALAHIDTVFRVAALPVKVLEDGTVELALEQQSEFLRPDQSGRATGLPVMIGAFSGDYFQALRNYGELLQRGSFRFSTPPADAYEPIWCSWGFERKVVPDDILRTLPEVKNLSVPWVVMDDGYQSSVGCWPLDQKKFPRGDTDMRALVDSIHAAGMKAKLWWVPMNVSPDDPLYAEHPEWVVLDKEGKPKREPWWNVFQLCPALPGVVEQQRALVRRFMTDWDYDGFKMDGSCLDMVAPCYNPAHHHQRPEESCEAVARFFAALKAEAESIKPGCVLEICECGIPQNPFTMAHYNQQVTADPVSSDQVRARIKTFQALLGRKAAPYGDHVELATGPYKGPEVKRESGSDFASTLALGGVIGTKFTTLEEGDVIKNWKKYMGLRSHWQKWFSLYRALRLYEGEYLNLYDIAYDVPETHVVAKGDTLYYGMFAENYAGKAPLRGLKSGVRYTLTEYDNNDRPLGELAGGPEASLDCEFSGHFLVRAAPLP
ncbi:MAG TPA: alpha-galactosidase [archaeon]|nr:alpha-galactosidase [archaeon]